MKFRKLRIAWTVGWGIACLLLVALWVRSYWRFDTTGTLVNQTQYSFTSLKGCVILLWADASSKVQLDRNFFSMPASKAEIGQGIRSPYLAFQYKRYPTHAAVIVPIWFTVLLPLGMGAVP